uniref:Knottin scorpion toxin-like domain-containing protein n=1 Tax=Oryza brachyantha TaxID=4533 RepID=J3LW57_ORYBR
MKATHFVLVAIAILVLSSDISRKVSATEECHSAPITEVTKPCVDAVCKAVCTQKYHTSRGHCFSTDGLCYCYFCAGSPPLQQTALN